MKNLLALAYYFPPCGGGGVMRMLAMVKYLPSFGWNPIVLTVQPRYYSKFQLDHTLTQLIRDVNVHRTSSLELGGRFNEQIYSTVVGVKKPPKIITLLKPLLKSFYHSIFIPDEKILWLPYAIREGLKVCKSINVRLIYATVPPHSSAIIAYLLSLLSNKPLVVDFRDDWVGNPVYASTYRFRSLLDQKMEKAIVNHAFKVISVTENSRALFLEKYPEMIPQKFLVIPNGFDPDELERVPETKATSSEMNRRVMRIIYAGGLWRKRSPVALYEALKMLREDGMEIEKIRVDFYGPCVEEFRELVDSMNLTEIVKFHGNIGKFEILQEIKNSDVGLVIIPHEEGGKTAIPGKVYEYIGLGKYVLALCPSDSALALLVTSYMLGSVAPLDDPNRIREEIKKIFLDFNNGSLQMEIKPEVYERFNRMKQVEKLSEVFDQI